MSTTPNLGLELVPSNSLQPWVSINDTLQLLDVLVQLRPQDKDLTAPPTTVSGDVGKCWLIAPSATGAWAGKDGQIALCTAAGVWRYIVPKVGYEGRVLDEDLRYKYTAAGTWVAA